VVLLAAIIIAAGSTLFMLTRKPAPKKIILSYNCFQTDHGWGYDITMNHQVVIHQPFIPGTTGTNGFTTKEQATAVALIVIEKIKSHQIPSVSHQQLQQLGVLPTQSK
jgi:Domain of unknown function (DUF4907)